MESLKGKWICNQCVCLPVCSIFRATDGMTQCKYFYDRRGTAMWVIDYKKSWVNGQTYKVGHKCSNCGYFSKDPTSFCPHCGRSMKRAISDG